MPWICAAFYFRQSSGGNSGSFYPVLRGYSGVFGQDISWDLKYRKMRDFNMAERQQIESKLKKCFILAVYMT